MIFLFICLFVFQSMPGPLASLIESEDLVIYFSTSHPAVMELNQGHPEGHRASPQLIPGHHAAGTHSLVIPKAIHPQLESRDWCDLGVLQLQGQKLTASGDSQSWSQLCHLRREHLHQGALTKPD
jgi:hypothetical protein